MHNVCRLVSARTVCVSRILPGKRLIMFWSKFLVSMDQFSVEWRVAIFAVPNVAVVAIVVNVVVNGAVVIGVVVVIVVVINVVNIVVIILIVIVKSGIIIVNVIAAGITAITDISIASVAFHVSVCCSVLIMVAVNVADILSTGWGVLEGWDFVRLDFLSGIWNFVAEFCRLRFQKRSDGERLLT